MKLKNLYYREDGYPLDNATGYIVNLYWKELPPLADYNVEWHLLFKFLLTNKNEVSELKSWWEARGNRYEVEIQNFFYPINPNVAKFKSMLLDDKPPKRKYNEIFD